MILPAAVAEVIVSWSLKYTRAWMSSAPAPALLIVTAVEPGPSSTIEPTPVVRAWFVESDRMLGLAMIPPWMMNTFAPTESPMFNADNVTLAFSRIVLSPRMLLLRFATSPMASGLPKLAVQLAGEIHE